MKKLLLATTALAALAATPGVSQAQQTAAGPIRLGLGGYFQFYGVFGNQDDSPGSPGASRHNFDFKREGEIFFLGQTKLDNGLMIGVDVQLESEPSADQIDESYIWFQGGWGRLILGSENSAAYLLSVGSPTVDANFDGQDPNYRLPTFGVTGDPRTGAAAAVGAGAFAPASAGGIGVTDIGASVVNITGDTEKITYLSPRIAGFRAGLSYTPDNSEEGNGAGQTGAAVFNAAIKGGTFAGQPFNNNFGQFSNIGSAGLNYEGAIGPASLLAGVSYETGFLEEQAVSGGVTLFKKRREAYSAGFDAGLAGFHFGALYYRDDNGFREAGDQTSWAVGLTYTMGPLTLGTNYYDSRREENVTPDERLRRWLVGARYVVGPGVDIRSSVQYYNHNAPSASDLADNNAWFFVVGTNLTF